MDETTLQPMQPEPPSRDEAARLSALRGLGILDTPNDPRFDRVTRLAQRIFAVPMVTISLVDADRQWFKSCVGIDVRETPRSISFCTHAILGDTTLVVEDAHRDPRFHDNPLVTGPPGIRFYAGRPLKSEDGFRVGALCLMDRVPRSFSDQDRIILDDLAELVEEQMLAVKLEASAVRYRQRIERLNAFNLFLHHASAAIHRLDHIDAIMAAVCEAAVEDGDFLLAWAGIPTEAGDRIVPSAATGVATDYVGKLMITTDPALETSHGPTRRCMVEKRIIVSEDFAADSSTGPWHVLAEQYGIRSSAAVPIIVEGKAVATLTFYSGYVDHFDAELTALLDEAARIVSMSLQAALSARDKEKAETERRASENRFKRAFNASPLPMQIVSLGDGSIRFVNKAYKHIFGYRSGSAPDVNTWFSLAFPDQEEATRRLAEWREIMLPRAVARGPDYVSVSPELRLACDDGTRRVCRLYTSASGDDIVVQFLDLTELKQRSAELVEREQGFRRMVEQSPLGIFVTYSGEIVYANPRFCEITGWSAEEIIGKDSCDLLQYDAETAALVRKTRQRVLDGVEQTAQIALEARSRSGARLDLISNGMCGVWDGKPANVVMIEDVTDRKRAQEQIATYVAELEGTVATTLEAVATMVEMRDPYTAGHENRVGIIAADIAREMGWSAERCHSLQLAGLVHDIGKISIPAEILTKPSRLTPLEYEMIKTHAERGYEILKNIKGPVPIAEIIRGHHERMDGSGYPQGLKGPEILPETRILAVADVLESMASHRPYRPALGLDAGLKELQDHRGTWFDDDVVAAVMRLVQEKGYTLPQ